MSLAPTLSRGERVVSDLCGLVPAGHETGPSAPSPRLLAPPSRRRQTARPRLVGWHRSAASGARAPPTGRRLGATGRRRPGLSTEERAAEAQRRAAAVHRPDLPPAEEHDPNGQNGESEGAGAAEPQSPRRDREIKVQL